MSRTYGIKITGVLAREGYYGRVRFAVCDRDRGRWVDARFPVDVDGARGWLRVDDPVFAVAAGLYLARGDADARVARAELVLGDGPVDDGAPFVVELRSIWLADATPAHPP